VCGAGWAVLLVPAPAAHAASVVDRCGVVVAGPGGEPAGHALGPCPRPGCRRRRGHLAPGAGRAVCLRGLPGGTLPGIVGPPPPLLVRRAGIMKWRGPMTGVWP